jgi:hypothetical protein
MALALPEGKTGSYAVVGAPASISTINLFLFLLHVRETPLAPDYLSHTVSDGAAVIERNPEPDPVHTGGGRRT